MANTAATFHAGSLPVIAGSGTPDSLWLDWTGLAQVQAVSASDLCAARSRLVVLAPHPDDEILACGGLIALHAATGGEVLIVSASDGEASHRSSMPHNNDRHREEANLAKVRQQERASGLQRLTSQTLHVHGLHLPDGELAANFQQLVQSLTNLLRPGDVLVTTWRRDAHPDHDACGEAGRAATARAGCTLVQAPVWMWHWSLPGDARVPWGAMAALALPPRVVMRKQLALAAHTSQLTPRSATTGPVLNYQSVSRAARAHEYFFVQQER